MPILQNQNMVFNVSCEIVIAEFIRYKRHDQNQTWNEQKRRKATPRTREVRWPTVREPLNGSLNRPTVQRTVGTVQRKIWPLHCQIFLWTVERFIEPFNGLWTVERSNEPFQRFRAQKNPKAYLKESFPPFSLQRSLSQF